MTTKRITIQEYIDNHLSQEYHSVPQGTELVVPVKLTKPEASAVICFMLGHNGQGAILGPVYQPDSIDYNGTKYVRVDA